MGPRQQRRWRASCLIEAPDPSVNSLTNAVRLANQMAPGVVSMSFGLAEASWTTQPD
ncbi:MAG: hypothetical protein IPL70_06955 [Uliginosibacterium sp.]|nr:hypothetical protein [Uliginosibacterium sp.]